MSTNNDGWLTVQEAAKLIGYHPERIRELVRQGKVKAKKFSIVWQVERQSLLDYLESMKALGKKRGRNL